MRNDSTVRNEVAELLAGLLFHKELPPITDSNLESLRAMFDKYDLHDVYNMANNRALLEWRAATAAESEGLLDEGVAELLFTDAGVDTDELENRITRYKMDKLRIDKAELFTPPAGEGTYIRCMVDGKEQAGRKLSEADVAGKNPFVDVTGQAVKYFQDVLDEKRMRNRTDMNGGNEKMISVLMEIKENLKRGCIDEELYRKVCIHENDLRKAGITPNDVRELMELKAKSAFCPDPYSYSIQEPEKVDYIYENADNPHVILSNEEDKCFLNAVRDYYSMNAEYKQRIKEMLGQVDALRGQLKYNHEAMYEEEEIKVLTDMFFRKKRTPELANSYGADTCMLHKNNLADAYYVNDNGVSLQWKAGIALEAKGLLSRGTTENLLKGMGVSADMINEHIRRIRVDKLRVSDVEKYYSEAVGEDYIRCKVDGIEQEERKLIPENAKWYYGTTEFALLAVKYYRDVLDNNREKGMMTADERMVERMDMPDVERLIDIYRNGVNEPEMKLAKVMEKSEVDNFWWGYFDSGLDSPRIEEQKRTAFYILGAYLDELRPGMLTNGEIIELCKANMVHPDNTVNTREEEGKLMKLPEAFFPMIEQSGEFDENMIAYVKVLRDMGRITPKSALQSMEYYLSTRAQLAWDPDGCENDFGELEPACYYPNIEMENPAGKFPPNLINEREWHRLSMLHPKEVGNEVMPFVPPGAFKTDRISDVQVYTMRDGRTAIRCTVDNEQQGSRFLSETDAKDFSERVNRKELAARYFMDAFIMEPERNVALGR